MLRRAALRLLVGIPFISLTKWGKKEESFEINRMWIFSNGSEMHFSKTPPEEGFQGVYASYIEE